MELSERLNEIRKIFTRRKTIELKPTIQPEEVDLLEQKYVTVQKPAPEN